MTGGVNSAGKIKAKIINIKQYRTVTLGQANMYSKLSRFANELNPMQFGDEFFGRIKNTKDNGCSLEIDVQTLVGGNIGEKAVFVNISDRNGDILFPKLMTRSVTNHDNESMSFIVEKPVDLQDLPMEIGNTDMINTLAWSLPFKRQIFANYNDDTIRLYQIFNKNISSSLLENSEFGNSFNYNRVTWFKPSFLWALNRSKMKDIDNGKHMILAIDINRDAFENILENSHIANPVLGIYFESDKEFASEAAKQPNTVQWDPDKNVHGHRLLRKAIQIGIHPSFHAFFENNIINVQDMTSLAKSAQKHLSGKKDHDQFLPYEFSYPVKNDIIHMLEMNQYYIDESLQIKAKLREITTDL